MTDVPARVDSHGRWRSLLRWIGRVGVLLYLVLLLATGIRGLQGAVSDVSMWDLQNTSTLLRFLQDLATLWIVDFVRPIPIGALAMLAVGVPGGPQQAQGRRWLGLLFGAALTVLLLVVEEGRFPAGVRGVLAAGGCLLGAWMATAAARGIASLARRAALIAAVALSMVTAGTGVAYLALESAPLSFSAPPVTSEQKRHAYRVLDAARTAKGEVRRLRLTADDVNFLVAWGLSLGSPDRKGAVILRPGHAEAQASVRVPGGWLRGGFLNVVAAGALAIDDGRPRVRLERLRVGRLGVPDAILASAAPVVVWAMRADPDTRKLVKSVARLHFEQDAVEVVLQPRTIHPRILASLLARLGARPDVLAATQDQLQYLVGVAPALPVGDERFAAFVRAALARAMQRSLTSDPALENRAAVFALAVLLGHRRIEDFIGPVTTPQIRRLAAQHVGRVTVRGRSDWTQHFWISAGLALVSAETVSDAAGLLKEELDAGGGSGFSFGDLLADRAGTRFSLATTHDAAAARAMQNRLSGRWPLDDVFPQAADLPEGVQDAELTSVYGGVGGAPYQRLIAEIERRLDGCAALR
jgi:hypothetical protein